MFSFVLFTFPKTSESHWEKKKRFLGILQDCRRKPHISHLKGSVPISPKHPDVISGTSLSFVPVSSLLLSDPGRTELHPDLLAPSTMSLVPLQGQDHTGVSVQKNSGFQEQRQFNFVFSSYFTSVVTRFKPLLFHESFLYCSGCLLPTFLNPTVHTMQFPLNHCLVL